MTGFARHLFRRVIEIPGYIPGKPSCPQIVLRVLLGPMDRSMIRYKKKTLKNDCASRRPATKEQASYHARDGRLETRGRRNANLV